MKPRLMILTILLFAFAFVLNGCNLFGWTSGSDTESLIDDGNRLMRDGKYTEAVAKFAEAMDNDPNDSEARYYHAKATLRASGFNALSLDTEMTNSDFTPGSSLPFSGPGWTQEQSGKLYTAISQIYDDINPIYYDSTTGDISRNEVDIDYALAAGIKGILLFQDSNLDGVISKEDLGITIQYSDTTYEIANLFTLITGTAAPKPRPFFSTSISAIDSVFACSNITEFNSLVENVGQVTQEATAIILSITGDLGIDPAEVRKVLGKITLVAHKYKINDPADNDGDGLVNEEIIDGIDNDGDGRIDEDSVFDCTGFTS